LTFTVFFFGIVEIATPAFNRLAMTDGRLRSSQ